MLPGYTLVVDITTDDATIGEKEFLDIVAPCLAYLDALKGAFDKKPASTTFYPPQKDTSKGWSVRCVLIISLGKERAAHLMNLYQAIVYLIEFELPDFEVQAESSMFQLS